MKKPEVNYQILYQISKILQKLITKKDIDSVTIPMFKEHSRAFPCNFDTERTSFRERSKINSIRPI
jgi:hypothetical protein